MVVIGIVINASSLGSITDVCNYLVSVVTERIDKLSSFRIVIKDLNQIIDDHDRTKYFIYYQKILSMLYYHVCHATYAMNLPLTDVDIISLDHCGWDPLGDLTDIYAFEDVERNNSFFETLKDICDTYSQQIYDYVAVGGTFDHLHAGHKILLTMSAFITSKKLTVGVMDAPMERLKTKRAYEQMEPIHLRMETYNIVPIVDDFGPTITDESLQALVGSLETYKGCKTVNEERIKIGFAPLELFAIDVISCTSQSVLLENMQDKISSSYLREYIARTKTAE